MGMPQNLEDFSYLRLGVRMEFVNEDNYDGYKVHIQTFHFYVAWAKRTMLS